MYSLSLVSEIDCSVNPAKKAYCPINWNELSVKRSDMNGKMICLDNNALPNMDPTGTQIQDLNAGYFWRDFKTGWSFLKIHGPHAKWMELRSA